LAESASRPPEPPPLPAGLPVPVDDGGADHLAGRRLPSVVLATTEGTTADLRALADENLVVFVFPKIGRPDLADPPGWDDIPGARGCTQETCAYRDLHREFVERGYDVVGVAAQPVAELDEAKRRLQLPYTLLGDPDGQLGTALDLPTFTAAGMTLYKRLTFVASGQTIVKAFYPVFPPQLNAHAVLDWIDERSH
jgi:peroxiredoxin